MAETRLPPKLHARSVILLLLSCIDHCLFPFSSVASDSFGGHGRSTCFFIVIVIVIGGRVLLGDVPIDSAEKMLPSSTFGVYSPQIRCIVWVCARSLTLAARRLRVFELNTP